MNTILVVEDNFDNLTLVRLLLEREGYRVIQAGDGREGLELARREAPDLIALDLDMPVMDGWTFIREAAADPVLHNIPIVVVTAHLMPGERSRVITAGCAGYVSKPFKVAELIDEIRRCLV